MAVDGEDVLAGEQGVHVRPGLRLREGVRPGAALVGVLPPAVRVLAVHVEAVEGPGYLPLEAVIVLEDALFVEPVVGPSEVVRCARDHEALVPLGDPPLAVRVLDAHLEDVAVAVYVLGLEARLGLGLGPGPGV